MTTATRKVTLQDVKIANPGWFSPANKRFFGDCRYAVRYGRKSHQPYLVRSTYAWTDMFGGERRLHYRVNPLDEALDIRPLIDDSFKHPDDVTDWLREH